MSADRYVYLVEVRPVDASGTEQPQYWSAGQGDDPQPYGGIEFVNCLLGDDGPWTFSTEIPLDDAIGGRAQVGYGTLRLDMQFQDAFGLSRLALLYWDTRAVRIWRVREGAAWSLADVPMFRGTVDEPTWGRDTATVPLFDRGRELDVAWQPHTYAGTGEIEGHEGLKGQRKPKMLGRLSHVEPVALDHAVPGAGGDPYSRVTQVAEGGCSLAFLNVYERGLAFSDSVIDVVTDVWAWSPVAGHVAVDAGRGLLRFGSAPIGVITVDCQSEGATPSHVSVLTRVLLDDGAFTTADLDSGALATLEAATPGLCGVYVNDERTIGDVCDLLCRSIGAAWSFTPAGLFTARRIGFRASVATITEEMLLEDPRPVAVPPPAWKSRYGYSPVERPLSTADIGDAVVLPAVRDLVSLPFRYFESERPEIKAVRPLAREVEVPGRFWERADASLEANRQENLLTTSRRQYVLTLRAPWGQYREGDTVTWVYAGFGLDTGADFLIRAKTERPSFVTDEDSVELTLWGPFDPSNETRLAS